jgi:lipopolysaccharide biosynthesis glycosyltransferase
VHTSMHPRPEAGGTDDAAFHIAFGVDTAYFRYMGATIASIMENNPGVPIVFHVFAFSVSDEHRRKLLQLAEKYGVAINIHLIDQHTFRDFARFSSHSQYSQATFTRLLIPSALHGLTGKVLYLDADILCVGSIAGLRSMDLSDNIAAVVTDHLETTVTRQIAVLNLPHQRYFNAGVMYIDVDNWIANGITEKVMNEMLRKDRKLSFQDQDALNIVLDGRALFIDEKWNLRYNLEFLLKLGDTHMGPAGEGVLLHFTGRVKPWHDWCLHEAAALYVKYESHSPWAGTPLNPPRNYKEMHMFSRFLLKQGRWADGASWYVKYLSNKFSSVRKNG